MMNVSRPLKLLLWLLIPTLVWAETPASGEAAAPPSAASAVPASVSTVSAVPATITAASAVQAITESSAVSAPLADVPVASAVAAPPPPEGCRPTTFKAMAADKKAFNSQREKLDITEQARLFDEALALWTRAMEQCEGRTREQAQHNLTNSQRARAAISEQLSSGVQCVEIHKDAENFQSMAKQALSERRWSSAAILFHKSSDMWEMASEYCTGKMQETADRRHDETELDAHNAEYCAPLFERAREHTQKLRATTALLNAEEKRNLSMEAETLWRDAANQCMGATVKDVALNNAQALGRERGTPWQARRPAGMAAPVPLPAAETKPAARPDISSVKTPEAIPIVSAPASVAQAAAPTVKLSPPDASAVMIQKVPAALVAATQSPVQAASASAQASAVSPQPPAKFSAEHAVGLSEFSGHGTITWAVGDVYEGELVKGLRHGKGRFSWASGQTYDGDWQGDKAVGQARIRFVNGDRYEGGVRDSLPQGQGRMDFPSGESYIGNFVNGERDGQGVYHFLNGDQYSGEWKAGKKHGQGSYIWKNGSRREGRFENDKPVEEDDNAPSK